MKTAQTSHTTSRVLGAVFSVRSIEDQFALSGMYSGTFMKFSIDSRIIHVLVHPCRALGI
jgi:hypothetical protein